MSVEASVGPMSHIVMTKEAKSQTESGPERQVLRKKKDRKWMDAIMQERED
jgi:hypothetical protein